MPKNKTILSNLFIIVFLINLLAPKIVWGDFNVIELSKEIGFQDDSAMRKFVTAVNQTKNGEGLVNEKSYQIISGIYDKIKDKDFDSWDFQPRSSEGSRYYQGLKFLKQAIDKYFERRNVAIEEYNKNVGKIDIYEVLKGLELPNTFDGLYAFRDEINLPFGYQEENDKLDSKVKKIYDFLTTKREGDFNTFGDEREYLVRNLLELKDPIDSYLKKRKRFYDKNEKEIAFHNLVEKEKQNKGQLLINAYKNLKQNDKTSIINSIKLIANKVKGWCVYATRYTSAENWVLEIQDNCIESTNLIFDNPPLDASAYENKFMLIKGSITSKDGDFYIITAPDEFSEAIAVIPKKVLAGSKIQYNQDAVILCDLKDVVEVKTVSGATKIVCLIEVSAIYSSSEYQKFSGYVVGNPEMFPQDKYVKIEVSDWKSNL